METRTSSEAASESKKCARPLPRYTPNIVPLIDVLFMLLLFFLLSTDFRRAEADLPCSLPGFADPPGPMPVQVTIRPAGGDELPGAMYTVGTNTVSVRSGQELYQELTRIRTMLNSPDLGVLLDVQGDVRWGFVVEAYNQALRANFRNITFAQD